MKEGAQIVAGMLAGFMLTRVVNPLLRNFFQGVIMNIFTVKNFQTAFFVALGAGLYIGFVDRLIPSQLSLPVRNNGGNS